MAYCIVGDKEITVDNGRFNIISRTGRLLHSGTCAPDATPVQVYENFYTDSKKDGVKEVQVTIAYIDPGTCNLCITWCREATLHRGWYSRSQWGYVLDAVVLGGKQLRVSWADRPKIAMTHANATAPSIEDMTKVMSFVIKERERPEDRVKAVMALWREKGYRIKLM